MTCEYVNVTPDASHNVGCHFPSSHHEQPVSIKQSWNTFVSKLRLGTRLWPSPENALAALHHCASQQQCWAAYVVCASQQQCWAAYTRFIDILQYKTNLSIHKLIQIIMIVFLT